ncbi:hypothetical protein BJX70DRAFT_403293 [Aspergillus crustosus]
MNGSESLSEDQEADFMSQYSVTPESSDVEDSWDIYSDGSSSTTDSVEIETMEPAAAVHNAFSGPEVSYIQDDVNIHMASASDYSDTTYLEENSSSLDYCLIEVGENEDFASHLPVLSRSSIGQLGNKSASIMTATGLNKSPDHGIGPALPPRQFNHADVYISACIRTPRRKG